MVGVTVGHELPLGGWKPGGWRFASAFHLQPFPRPAGRTTGTQDLHDGTGERRDSTLFTHEHWAHAQPDGGHMAALADDAGGWGWDIDTPEDLAVANAMVAAGVAR